MKILLVTEFFPSKNEAMTGGVETRCANIAKGLERLGNQVKVVARSRRQVAATTMSILYRLWFQIGAIFQGMKGTFEVIEGSNFVTYWPAFVLAKLKRARAVSWYADVYRQTWFQTMSWPVALAGLVGEWVSLRLPWDQVIAMSIATKQKLIQAGVGADKIRVVYGGVDLERINNIKVNHYNREQIVTAARLVGYKQIDDLIRAVAIVKKSFPKVKLVILGDGPEKSKLIELSNKLLTNDSVLFEGSLEQAEVWSVLKESRLFCLPSTVEGFGLATVEAMACGCPYVSADIPATREVTEGGKGGILYQPKKVEELAEGIKALLRDQQLYQKKRAEGLTLAKKYAWGKIVEETLKVYQLN